MLSRLNKTEPSPAAIVECPAKGSRPGTYIQVGEDLSWKDPRRWLFFFVIRQSEEVRRSRRRPRVYRDPNSKRRLRNSEAARVPTGYVQAVRATDRRDALAKLARHYAGIGATLEIHDCMGPLSPEEVREIERINGRIAEKKGQRTRDLGARPSGESRSHVSPGHRGRVPAGV
jgi:hypothetical protein